MTRPRTAKQVFGADGPILLDFDGPICSIFAGLPATSVAQRLRDVLSAGGVTITPELQAIGDPLEVLRYSAIVGDHGLVTRVDDALRAAELAAVELAQPTTGAADVIATAGSSGRPIGVVSNNSGPAVNAYLATHGLTKYIGAVIGRAYADPEQMKPNRSPVVQAAHRLRVAPHSCVLVGDSISDVEAAHAAGAACIGLANRPYKLRAFATAGAEAIIQMMTELL